MLRTSLLLVVLAAPVLAGDDPVAARVDKALDTYKDEMKAYRSKATAWLDAREAAARKAGDKKAVDRVHEEQRVFRTVSDLPKSAPEDLRLRPVTAKAKLVKAYEGAVKEWTKAGEDKKAAAADADLKRLRDWYDPSISRRVWVHQGGSYTMEGKGAWVQRHPDGRIFKLTEADRTAEYVEITTTIGDVT